MFGAVSAMSSGWRRPWTGWTPDPANLFDFGVAVAFDEELANLDPAGVAAAIEAVTDARTADLKSLEPSIVDEPSMTPVGPQAYGNFLQIRVFDMWVHARDVHSRSVSTLTTVAPPAAMALNEVHRSMGYIAGKLIGLEDGMSMTVNVTGRRSLHTIHVAVDGRAALVDSLDSPDLTLTADTETFVMLACGQSTRSNASTPAASPGLATTRGARKRHEASASPCDRRCPNRR